MDYKDLLTLSEYAAQIGRDPDSVRDKCLRGNVPGAVKLGRNWFIPKDAPYDDKRVRSGKYVKARDKE